MIFGKIISGTDDLSDAFMIRREVFQIEQGVPAEIEFDEIDKYALHGIVYFDEDRKIPVATGRIFYDGDKCYMGRIAVLKKYRGQYYGEFIVKLLLNRAFTSGIDKVYIHAQTVVTEFYKKFGFKQFGDEFLEANIKHVEMYVDSNSLINDCERMN